MSKYKKGRIFSHYILGFVRCSMLIKFDKDSFPEEVFEEKNIVSRTDEIVNVQVIGTSMELDNLVSEVQNNKPIEIVRSGPLGISSGKNTLSIEN